jgi:broad specificity phosphatase PhoE
MMEVGFLVFHYPLFSREKFMRYLELRRHTMRHKPGKHLTQAGVTLARKSGDTMSKFDYVVTSTLERAYETAIAMGYAVDAQIQELAMIADGVEAELGSWDVGFAGWGELARQNTKTAKYVKAQAKLVKNFLAKVPEGGAVLVVSHGGVVEAQAVGCMPEADFAAWGDYVDYCEGVRLTFDGDKFINAEIKRSNPSPLQ